MSPQALPRRAYNRHITFSSVPFSRGGLCGATPVSSSGNRRRRYAVQCFASVSGWPAPGRRCLAPRSVCVGVSLLPAARKMALDPDLLALILWLAGYALSHATAPPPAGCHFYCASRMASLSCADIRGHLRFCFAERQLLQTTLYCLFVSSQTGVFSPRPPGAGQARCAVACRSRLWGFPAETRSCVEP
jgi:hypothetical protein